MSNIRDKIKQLERLQKKVDFLKQVMEFPTKLKAGDADEKEVLPEVCKLVEELITPVIENLEQGNAEAVGTMGIVHEQLPFNNEEIGALKTLIDKVMKRPQEPIQEGPKPRPKEKSAAAAWALENQHLAEKRVKTMVLSKEMEGEVVGLKQPFVVIKLDNGKIHQATLDKVQII